MRRVLLGSAVVLLVVSGPIFAQNGNYPDASGGGGSTSASASGLPAHPVPVAFPSAAPPPPADAPPPQPVVLPSPAPIDAPPPQPDLLPPPAPIASPTAPPQPMPWDNDLDNFATRFWLSADYLLWWTKGQQLPPLVTTGSPNAAIPGALNQPGTQVLFGGNTDDSVRSGGRFRAGYWFTRDQTFGIDGTFFLLGGQSGHFYDSSNGIPLLARPFYNVNTNQEDATVTAYPGQQSGSIQAGLSSHLWGGDMDLRGMLFRGPSYQVSLLGGFRFLDLNEALRMKEMDTIYPSIGNDSVLWTTISDHFHTSNQFYGGQLGTDVMWSCGRFFVDFLGKVGLGTSVESANINGWTNWSTSDGQSGKLNIGQLAQPSNIGHYSRNQFAVVPEFGLNLGYSVTRHIRLTFGYTFLYWSSVFRVADQIDRSLNPTEFLAVTGNGPMIGPPRPAATLQGSDFWAQGLNFGLQFRY